MLSNFAKIMKSFKNQGGNCPNWHQQPVRQKEGVSFKPNWRKVSSKVFSFASYLLAMDWRTFLVVPLPEGCSSNSRYPRPSEEYLYGKLFMSVLTMVWATIITKEHPAKLLYNVFRHFCSKSNLRWQHLWILLHAEMINHKGLTFRLKQKGVGMKFVLLPEQYSRRMDIHSARTEQMRTRQGRLTCPVWRWLDAYTLLLLPR